MPNPNINRRLLFGNVIFNGVLDIYSGAVAGYSLRLLRRNYTGSCIRVRRSSDSTEMDIGFVNNYLDTATLLTFCGAGDGFIRTWYDQTTSGYNLAQGTAGAQPQIVSSGALITSGTRGSLYFLDTSRVLNASAAANWKFLNDGTQYSIYSVAQFGVVANPSAQYFLMGTNNATTANTGMYFVYRDNSGSNDKILHLVGNSSGAAATSPIDNNTSDNYCTPNTLHVFSILNDPSNATVGSRSEIRIDGGIAIQNNTANGAVDSGNPAFPIQIGGRGNAADMVGYVSELLFYPVKQTASNSSIENNLLDYY